MQPPQHEHKTNTRPSCVGDRSLSLPRLLCSSIPSLSLLLFLALCLSLSIFLSLSPPCKLDSGNITMLFSLFPSLSPNCLVFQDHWALLIGCAHNWRAASLLLCLRAVPEQRWDKEMDSIPQKIIQPQATDGDSLHAAHCNRFIKENVNKYSQEEPR